MMKKHLVYLLAALALLFVPAAAARADQFDRMQNNPNIYWVPAPTPPPPYYAGPPRYYGPPPPPVVVVPRFFIGIHFH